MTLEKFYTRILQKLGVLAAGEAPSAEDRELVVDTYAGVFENLQSRIGHRVYWSLSSEVPEEVVLPLVAVCAHALRHEFTVPPDLKAELEYEAETGPDPAWGKILAATALSQPDIRLDYY